MRYSQAIVRALLVLICGSPVPVLAAAKKRLNGHVLIHDVIGGVRFIDGERAKAA